MSIVRAYISLRVLSYMVPLEYGITIRRHASKLIWLAVSSSSLILSFKSIVYHHFFPSSLRNTNEDENNVDVDIDKLRG